MERKAAREIKRQQAAAEAGANRVAKDQVRAAHKAALAAHLGQQAMTTTLAAGATNDEVIASRMAAYATSLRAGDSVHMQHD